MYFKEREQEKDQRTKGEGRIKIRQKNYVKHFDYWALFRSVIVKLN